MSVQTPLQLGLESLKAQKLDEAIKHLEEATVRFPEDYLGFNYLGVAYAQKGLSNRAIGAFQTAIQIRDSIPSIHYNLGLAYQAEGFPDKARDEFKQALGLDPSYIKAVEALKALDAYDREHNSLSTKSCARHSDEPAIAVCSLCQLPVCSRCKVEIAGETLCNICAERRK